MREERKCRVVKSLKKEERDEKGEKRKEWGHGRAGREGLRRKILITILLKK